MTKFICDHPWTHFEVNNPNGDVTMCCDNNTVLGNINEASIDEIWNSDGYQAIRKDMRDKGAHSICPANCPILHGYKTYQKLDWHKDLPDDHAEDEIMRENAALNDEEFAAGKAVLASKPRWMRFAYSFLCNLDCYHCFQREDATKKEKLPESFLTQVYEHAAYYQVLFFFGGEPFLYKPVTKMMQDISVPPSCQFFLITNGTLLKADVVEALKKRNIGIFSVSLDAATPESFDKLRLRGAKSSWQDVMDGVRQVAALKEAQDFRFTLSMTVNSVNALEIEPFVDLAISVGAEPLFNLVANPYQTYAFHREFLSFQDKTFDDMFAQIDRSLKKVETLNYADAALSLTHLRKHLSMHRRLDNRPGVYFLRLALRRLPAPLKNLVRRLIAE